MNVVDAAKVDIGYANYGRTSFFSEEKHVIVYLSVQYFDGSVSQFRCDSVIRAGLDEVW